MYPLYCIAQWYIFINSTKDIYIYIYIYTCIYIIYIYILYILYIYMYIYIYIYILVVWFNGLLHQLQPLKQKTFKCYISKTHIHQASECQNWFQNPRRLLIFIMNNFEQGLNIFQWPIQNPVEYLRLDIFGKIVND